jgi:succinate dehydrogenase/fumarate reductase flavoprotein subunit
MRRLIAATLAGSALMFFAVSANAQYQHRDDYRNRGGILEKVSADLDRAKSHSYANGGDRKRFNHVREELNEFRRSGNPHELKDAISRLQKVVNDNRLAPRDRDVLADDLYKMREFRASNGWR